MTTSFHAASSPTASRSATRWAPAPARTEDVRVPLRRVASSPRRRSGTPRWRRRAVEEALAVRDEVGRLPSHVRRRRCSPTARRHRRTGATDFEQLLVLETGKPLVDCRVEVDRTLLTLQTAAEEVARLHGETVPLDLLPSGEGLLGFWVRKPIGVVVGIAGFNYPLLLATHKIAPALAAGCPIVAKPAPQTPLATLWLVHLVREALAAGRRARGRGAAGHRRPGGRASRSPPTPGSVPCPSPGRPPSGHQIARDAAPTKVLLELGSNAALVVAADADLDAAADAVVRGGYYASGQACISVQRVIVVEPVRDAFAGQADRADGPTSSSATRATRDPGLRAHRRPLDRPRVASWVDEAVAAGCHGRGRRRGRPTG